VQDPFGQQAPIPGVKHIVAIASGKGGVGKSTVSANLAVALAKSGAKVGLLDCDIYGPSIPRLFGTINQKPSVSPEGKIQPLERYGVKLMSIGYLVDENAAIVWRGPMLFKAMEQFFKDVAWGELDYLLVDLPPGTGDVQLTLAQKVPVAGALTICTPQNLALIDVKRALDMFMRINIPVLGLVENMSYLIAPESGERVQMFPRGELDSFLDKSKIPKLMELPFYTGLAKASEVGVPVCEGAPSSEEAKAFMALAKIVKEKLV
jgi:ATP-binding protein involved in chromosome partitioning